MASLNICDLEGGWPLERSIPVVGIKHQHSNLSYMRPAQLQRTFVFQNLGKVVQGGQRCGLVNEFLEQSSVPVTSRECVDVLRRPPCPRLGKVPMLREYAGWFPTCNAP